MHEATLGVTGGNRGFFPDHRRETGKQEALRVLAEEGIKAITLDASDRLFGSVKSLQDAEKCSTTSAPMATSTTSP
jgi:hypothetical protein